MQRRTFGRLTRSLVLTIAISSAGHAVAAETRGTGEGAKPVQQTKEYGGLSLSLTLTPPPPGSQPSHSPTSIQSTDLPSDAVSQEVKELGEIQAKIEAVEALIKAQQELLTGTPALQEGGLVQFGRELVDGDAMDRGTITTIVALLAAIVVLWTLRQRSARAARRSRYQQAGALPKGGAYGRLDPDVDLSTLGIDVSNVPDTIQQSVLPPESEALEVAEVYLRFGHDKLAEEALKEAVRHNPMNAHAYLQLLRIYFSREDRVAFSALAQQVQALGDEPVWSRVVEMGRALDPDDPRYS